MIDLHGDGDGLGRFDGSVTKHHIERHAVDLRAEEPKGVADFTKGARHEQAVTRRKGRLLRPFALDPLLLRIAVGGGVEELEGPDASRLPAGRLEDTARRSAPELRADGVLLGQFRGNMTGDVP